MSRIPRYLVAILLLLALGTIPLSAFSQDSDQESTAQDAAESPEADSPKTAASEKRLLEEASEIAEQVAKIRGIGLRHEIEKGIRNRDQLRKVLIQKLAEQVSDADIESEAKVYKHLGLMKPETDYKQMLLDVLTEQIAGFYDQHAEELYIMRGIPLSLQRPAMAHEIYHAIQDQHFDIEAMTEPISSRENGDFSLARSALIEGDATVVMIDFSLYEEGALPQQGVSSVIDIPMMANMLRKLSMTDIGALQSMVPNTGESGDAISAAEISETALSKAPRMVRKLLVFPYFGGMRFIIDAREGQPWSRVNAIYEQPPVSTEQILHPQRYFDGDQPVHLNFEADSILDAYDPIYDTVLGEYQMRLMIEEHLVDDNDPKDSVRTGILQALHGWDGDRLLAYEDDSGEVVTAHVSVWDTIEDAREYYHAANQMTQARFPDASARQAKGKHGQSMCYRLGDNENGERVYIERWGDLVLHIEGTPSRLDENGHETDPTTYMLREKVWRTLDRKAFSDHLEEKIAQMERENEASTDEAAPDTDDEDSADTESR
ncbi:MAG: hypothetical protein ACQEVA_10865 [Myxococcota bacterium]